MYCFRSFGTSRIIGIRPDSLPSSIQLFKKFKGKPSQCEVVFENGECRAYVGLGESKSEDWENKAIVRNAVANGVRALKAKGIGGDVEIDVGGEEHDAEVAEAAVLGSYRFDLKSKKDDDSDEQEEDMRFHLKDGRQSEAWKEGEICSTMENEARTLCNKPGNFVTPSTFCEEVKAMATKYGISEAFSLKVFEEDEIRAMNMNGIWTVGKVCFVLCLCLCIFSSFL